jgi:hypothetical protein
LGSLKNRDQTLIGALKSLAADHVLEIGVACFSSGRSSDEDLQVVYKPPAEGQVLELLLLELIGVGLACFYSC